METLPARNVNVCRGRPRLAKQLLVAVSAPDSHGVRDGVRAESVTQRLDCRRNRSYQTSSFVLFLQRGSTMVKAYLRYVEKASFGVVYSPGVDVHLDHSGNLVVCGALDSVQVWNAKQGELVKQLRAPEHKTTSGARTKEPPAVTRLLPIPNSTKFAAGYWDCSRQTACS